MFHRLLILAVFIFAFNAHSADWIKIPLLTNDSDQTYAGYTDLWALSDIHGHRTILEDLLKNSGLVSIATSPAKTTWVKKNQLLLIVGDVIDLNDKEAKSSEDIDESAEMLLELQDLQNQAKQNQSRILIMLGNHEINALAHPDPDQGNLEKGFLKSFARVLNTKKSKLTTATLQQSEAWKFMSEMSLGLSLADSIWVHSGKFSPTDGESLEKYLGRLSTAPIKKLSEDSQYSAPFSAHDWYKESKKSIRKFLEINGVHTLIVGHEKNLFKDKSVASKIAFDKKGWLLKLDTGVKRGGNAQILHCSFQKLKKGAAAGQLIFYDGNKPRCEALGTKGTPESIKLAD